MIDSLGQKYPSLQSMPAENWETKKHELIKFYLETFFFHICVGRIIICILNKNLENSKPLCLTLR